MMNYKVYPLIILFAGAVQTALSQNVGINNANPQGRLHINGGDLIVASDTGFGIYRMHFLANRAALRVGVRPPQDNVNGQFFDRWGGNYVGFYSLAANEGTVATGAASVALGSYTEAIGYRSMTMGYYTLANSYASVAMGQYNINEGNPTSWVITDPLFTIGNGTSHLNRSNALTVLKNGRIGIGNANEPAYRISIVDNNLGIDRPADNTMAFYTNGAERLRLTGNGRVGIGLTNPGAPLEVSNENAMIRITNPTGGTTGIEFLRSGGGDDWRLHNTGGLITLSRSTNDLGSVTDHYVFTQSAFRPAVDNTQTVGQGNFRWVSVHATNGTIQTSDARLKENIQPLDYGLQTVAQLRPVSYRWKDNPAGDAHLGFLAQEVQALIPEAVHDAGNGQPLGMQYSELIPVLVKAIQEQEERLKKVEAENKLLRGMLEKRK
jgi:hypothetical protein